MVLPCACVNKIPKLHAAESFIPVHGHTWCMLSISWDSKLIDYSFLFSLLEIPFLTASLAAFVLFCSPVSLPIFLCQGQMTIKKPPDTLKALGGRQR